METNLKHPSLKTHKFSDFTCKLGDVFETYAQNNTPGAYRIFGAYGPNKNELYIRHNSTSVKSIRTYQHF